MFNTLAEAEEHLQNATLGIGSSKLELVRVLRSVQHNKLYEEAINPKTETNIKTLEEYLKVNADTFKRIAGIGKQQIYRTLRSFAVFVESLDFPDDIILDMGEHLTILAEAANVDFELHVMDMDGPSPYGGEGKLLGQQHLRDQALEIIETVQGEETKWLVKDTRDLVDQILGKKVAPTPEWVANVYTTANTTGEIEVHISKLSWYYDGEVVELSCQKTFSRAEYDRFCTREKIRTEGIDGFGF